MATQVEVGLHLDLADRTVRALIDRGILPAARRGDLDIDACRIAYIRHLRETAAGRAAGPGADDLTAERARLAREQADHFALKNAAMRMELLPRTEITRTVTAAFQIVRDRLTALPTRLTAPLAGCSDPAAVRARLSDAVATVLDELAEERIVSIEEPADAD